MRIMFIILLGLISGFCLLSSLILPFLCLALIFYLWLLFEYPEIALFVSFLVIVNCFSMMDENIFRLPNLFRLRDLFFLSMFIPLFVGLYKRDKKAKYVFNNPIAKCISFILILSFIQIFVTHLRFGDESINSILRMGRRYFYYSLFFPALYILLDKKRFKRFAKLFIISVVIFCFLYIIQFLIGPTHKIILKGRVEFQNLQGYRVTRMYIFGVSAAALIFQISFMVFLFYKDFKYRVKNIFIAVLSGIQTLVTFGRAHIFGVVTGTLFVLFCVKGKMKIKAILKILVSLLVIIVVLFMFKILFQPEKNIIKPIFTRISSTYSALSNQGDTFEFRLKDNMGRFALIKRNPIFGIGFIHDDSDLFAFAKGFDNSVRTGDSGIVVLLIDFGIIGVIWLLAMSGIVLKMSLALYKGTENFFYKSVILGVVAFYFGRLFSFITLEDFVVYDGIVIIVLSLVLLEVLRQKIMLKEENL